MAVMVKVIDPEGRVEENKTPRDVRP